MGHFLFKLSTTHSVLEPPRPRLPVSLRLLKSMTQTGKTKKETKGKQLWSKYKKAEKQRNQQKGRNEKT